jgi:hypothetical protein
MWFALSGDASLVVGVVTVRVVTLPEDRLCRLAGFTLLICLGIDPCSEVGRRLLSCTADTSSDRDLSLVHMLSLLDASVANI